MSAWSPSLCWPRNLTGWASVTAKAGTADYVWALDLGEFVDLLGPPRIQPRPHWRGSTEEALALLAPLPDEAGPDVFWHALA